MIISFMGPQHGRIIQAHHDGEKLVIRYSPLYSFVYRDKAPFEFFLRCCLNEPIGVTEVVDCVRERREVEKKTQETKSGREEEGEGTGLAIRPRKR
jgi:hypothetical protein